MGEVLSQLLFQEDLWSNFCTLQGLLNYYFKRKSEISTTSASGHHSQPYLWTRASTTSTAVPIVNFLSRSGSFLKSIVPILCSTTCNRPCCDKLVSNWSLTADTGLRCQANPCGICGGRSGIETPLPDILFSCHYPFKRVPYSFLHPSQRLHNLNTGEHR